MALHEAPYYTAKCDFPGCDVLAEYGEFSALTEPSLAIEMAVEEGDWRPGQGPRVVYCPNHPAVTDVDIEDGDTPPAPPYVLVNDETGLAKVIEKKVADPRQLWFGDWTIERGPAVTDETSARIQTLRDAADDAFADPDLRGLQKTLIGTWLRDRADRIEKGES